MDARLCHSYAKAFRKSNTNTLANHETNGGVDFGIWISRTGPIFSAQVVGSPDYKATMKLRSFRLD